MVKFCFTIALALIACTGIQAQTADEIVNKNQDALGGKDKIAQLKSVYMESNVQIMGNDAPSSTTILNNKGFRFEMDMNGLKIIQVFTDKGGWAISPMGGSTSAQDLPTEMWKQGKAQIDLGGPLFNYASKGGKIELLGKDDSTYKIKLTTSENTMITFYIDKSTYLVRKSVQTGNMMGQSVELTTSLSDWKKSDAGVLFPHTIAISGGQFALTTTVTKLTTNQPVDPKIFDKPTS